jgi:hypothetical protein
MPKTLLTVNQAQKKALPNRQCFFLSENNIFYNPKLALIPLGIASL